MKTTHSMTVAMAVLVLGISGCGGDRARESGGQLGEAHPEDGHVGRVVVPIDDAAVDRLGLRIAEAGPGDVETTIELPGEVRVNGDRMAHVSPRVGGVVRQVHASLGDTVRDGVILAVLDSRELADAKAAFLAARERLSLAEASFKREERLWNERVSSEQDYLDARRGRAEARIELRAVEQKLHALGVPQSQLDELHRQPDASFTSYRLTAPFDGTVIDRHITIGETVAAGEPVFTVADLSSVWIDLSVYQRDIGAVRDGQTVRVETPHGDDVRLSIDFVQPLVGESTRTATARVIAPNETGIWHPGCFVTASVSIATTSARVVVPDSAVITMDDGDTVVFVATAAGFETRLVEIGRRAGDDVEIVAGLEPGDRYVAAGGFSLKAELGKDAFGDGHGH
jgi:cobalt-zinc-cadmium efflux system membrane fusion protein